MFGFKSSTLNTIEFILRLLFVMYDHPLILCYNFRSSFFFTFLCNLFLKTIFKGSISYNSLKEVIYNRIN